MTAAKKMVVSERDEALAAEAMPLVVWQSRHMGRLPEGLDVEDLESVGHEAVLEACVKYDEACGVQFKTFARTIIKSRMLSVVKAARVKAKGRVPLQVVGRDGNSTPLPVDKRAHNPAKVAEDRDELRRTLTVASVTKSIPSPSEVSARVNELRAAMFTGLDPAGIKRVMQQLMRQAEGGDLKAMRLLVDLLAPKTSGVAVLQESVIVNTTEVR